MPKNPALYVTARHRLNVAIAQLDEATDDLPALRAKCARRHTQHVVTFGLEQWCDYTAATNSAYSDGTGDYSDGPSYLRCTCGRVFAVPADVNWT